MQVYNYGEKTLEAAYWLKLGIAHGKTATIKATQPANFITPIGVFKKRKQIEARGLPNMANARFITLTLDRARMGDAETGYEVGKRHLRQFIYELRKKLGVTEEQCPHVWKLEFHNDGWAHWHIIFLYRKRLPFSLVDACWRLGRTNTQRLRPNDFHYLFKYATKAATLPQWVLDQKQLRFWQTSKHFYTRTTAKATASPRRSAEAVNTQKTIRKKTTLGERLRRWLRTISICIGNRTAVVEIASFPALLLRAALQAADDLATGFEPILITSNKITMPAQRAVEFMQPEFSEQLRELAA